MWWKMAGELVAKYYAAREEVEKDVEGRTGRCSQSRNGLPTTNLGSSRKLQLHSPKIMKDANYQQATQ